MHKKQPDPNGFLAYIRSLKPPKLAIYNGMELLKRANRFLISTETARGILRKEGWRLVPTSSETRERWVPPEEGG
ncbi:MAG: hypothetical protein APR56_08265 [Methanosaeta sp. SDB]|nr:MAG: hypothetical protein APR56_08265 [Methanosaeta sp. SDB]